MIPLRDDNPTRIDPVVTVGIIAACVLAFLWQLSLGSGNQRAVLSLGVIPAVLFHKAALPPELDVVAPWQTVFTSMFLHGGFMHIAGNMLYLWIFGNNVEDAMGHRRFIVFYLLCGVAAAYGQALVNPASQVPMIGASGAISGVLGAYLLLFPRARVLVAIPLGLIVQTMHLPALVVLGFWFVLQLLNSASMTGGEGGVAWFAHVGGFVAGMLLIPFFKHKDVPLLHPAHRRAGIEDFHRRW
jgi:membrane associated rhomboid family serine protease